MRALTVVAGGVAVAATLIGVALIGGGRGLAAPGGPVPEPSTIYTGCETTVLSPSSSAVACVPRFEMTPSPTYGTSATPTVPPLEYNKEQIARLSAAFERRLRALAPRGTTFLDTHVNGDAAGAFEFSVRTGGPADNGGRFAEGFLAGPDLRDKAGVSNVLFSIGRPISTEWPADYGVGQFRACPDPDCCEITGPHGEKIVAMWDFQAKPRIARIDVTKTDRTGVVLEVRNWGLDIAGSRPELPLTLEQMIELATDPALTMPSG